MNGDLEVDGVTSSAVHLIVALYLEVVVGGGGGGNNKEKGEAREEKAPNASFMKHSLCCVLIERACEVISLACLYVSLHSLMRGRKSRREALLI